jgi:hypothetical protein
MVCGGGGGPSDVRVYWLPHTQLERVGRREPGSRNHNVARRTRVADARVIGGRVPDARVIGGRVPDARVIRSVCDAG